MKLKYILIALIGLMSVGANAQITYLKTTNLRPNGIYTNPDTTINTDTTYLVSTQKSGLTAFGDIQLNFFVTNITGTGGGYVIAQGSADNLNWVTLVNDKNQSLNKDTTFISSLTGGAVVQGNYVFKNYPYMYVRLRYITSGTQTSTLTSPQSTSYIKQHN